MDLPHKYFLPQPLCLHSFTSPACRPDIYPHHHHHHHHTRLSRPSYRITGARWLAFATGFPQGTTTRRSPLVCHVIVRMCVKLIGSVLSEGILCRLPVNASWLVRDWWAAQEPWDAPSIGSVGGGDNAWSIAVTDEALCLPDIWRGTRLNAGDHLLSERRGWLDGSQNSMFSVSSDREKHTPCILMTSYDSMFTVSLKRREIFVFISVHRDLAQNKYAYSHHLKMTLIGSVFCKVLSEPDDVLALC